MTRNRRKLVPKAEAALDKMKHEVADEVGVDYKEGYNGDMTSHDAGRIGGNMVKKMIEKAENDMSDENEK
jgi:hypothetical protein